MEIFFTSTLTVLVAEIGDKTQLLALLLAAHFKKPVPIICGIFAATILNHSIAAYAGAWISGLFDPAVLRWIIALAFFAAAAWALIPDTVGEAKAGGQSAFLTSLFAFFIAENGDKTQLATAMLAAQYQAAVPVILGTTLGMMLANIPAVMCGEAVMRKIPLRFIRYLAAAIFAALGVISLLKEI